MAKQEAKNAPEPKTEVELLQEKIAAMREAQKVFATFTAEQVDKIFFEAAMAANKQRIPLAKMACEETGMGVVEDKVIKNHYAAEYMYNSYKKVKTVGVIEEEDRGTGRPCGSGHSDHEPDFYCNLQMSHLSEDQECNHHQPASACEEMYN